MTSIVICAKPSKGELEEVARTADEWFDQHPRRRVCHIDLWGRTVTVRKGNVLEDLCAACD